MKGGGGGGGGMSAAGHKTPVTEMKLPALLLQAWVAFRYHKKKKNGQQRRASVDSSSRCSHGSHCGGGSQSREIHLN
jgi:hypothetical protein